MFFGYGQQMLMESYMFVNYQYLSQSFYNLFMVYWYKLLGIFISMYPFVV